MELDTVNSDRFRRKDTGRDIEGDGYAGKNQETE